MKKNLKILWNIIQVFVLFYAFSVTILIINMNFFGYSELGKKTYVPITKENKEYLKKINVGDLLIIKQNKIRENDDIYYYIVSCDKFFISKSKVLKIKDNSYVDIDNFIIDSKVVIGNKSITIKGLGYLLSFLEGRIGYICFVILPMFIILIYHILDFSYNMRKLNKIRIENIKRELEFEQTFNNIDILDKIDNDIEFLDEKDDIEILDF